MVKWILLIVLALGGCALIDATSEEDGFEPVDCLWQPCSCGYNDCDPRFDCANTNCTTCRDDWDCAGADLCEFGLCSSCAERLSVEGFSVPVTIMKQEETFTCEADPSIISNDPMCLRDSCFQQ